MERKVALTPINSTIFPNTKLRDWKALLVHKAPSTQRNYRCHIKQFFASICDRGVYTQHDVDEYFTLTN